MPILMPLTCPFCIAFIPCHVDIMRLLDQMIEFYATLQVTQVGNLHIRFPGCKICLNPVSQLVAENSDSVTGNGEGNLHVLIFFLA